MRWNSPPNWPPPPPGWTPPEGWQPNPAWGPPPPGHTFWVPDSPTQPGYQPDRPGYQPSERGYQPNQPTAEFPSSAYPGAVPPGGDQGGRSGRSGLWIVVGLVTVLILALGGAVAVAVLGGDEDDDSPTSSRTDEDPANDPTDRASDEATEDPTDEPTDRASNHATEDPTDEATDEATEDPTDLPADGALPLGESASVGDWVVSVDAVEQDADQLIEDANEFNEPPTGQYVVAELTATYQGAGRSDAWVNVQPSFVEPDGTEHSYYECIAVVPEPGFNTPSLRRGDSASYQVCFDVPADSIAGGRIVVIDVMNFGDAGAAWAVQ